MGNEDDVFPSLAQMLLLPGAILSQGWVFRARVIPVQTNRLGTGTAAWPKAPSPTPSSGNIVFGASQSPWLGQNKDFWPQHEVHQWHFFSIAFHPGQVCDTITDTKLELPNTGGFTPFSPITPTLVPAQSSGNMMPWGRRTWP